jgi:hypothetical protein
MALSYTGQFLVPTASTFTSSGIAAIYYQLSSGNAGSSQTLQELLGVYKTVLESDWGGTFTWTTTTVGGNYQIDFVFTGLTDDPSNDPLTGDLAALVLVADDGNVYSSTFSAVCPGCPPSVNPEDATDCLSCYQQEADFCETPITILGLSDNTDYTLNILDSQSGKTYTYSVTTDGNGEADIDTADFPTGLFSPYNSPFTITIKDTNGNPVVLTYGYVNYSCIDLTIINSYSA